MDTKPDRKKKYAETEKGKAARKRVRDKLRDSGYFREYWKQTKDARKKKRKDYMQTPRGRFAFLKRRCRHLERECTLSLEQYTALLQKACEYCGGPLNKSGAGLDRLDTTRGYTPDNVVPCCGNCNLLKSHLLTSEETKCLISELKRLRGSSSVW